MADTGADVEVTFDSRVGPPPTCTFTHLDPDRATLGARDSLELVVDRRLRSVVCTAPRQITSDELLHPVLAFVGAAFARWRGFTALHAAVLVLGGRAWVMTGPPGAGKSTISIMARARGHTVMTDDLAVIGGGMVLAGVPVADLRRGNQARPDVELPGRIIDRLGESRRRYDLGPLPRRVELGGFVRLAWGDDVSVTALDVPDRLRLLGENEALGAGPSVPTAFLDLLSFPAYELRRPRGRGALDLTLGALVEVVSR